MNNKITIYGLNPSRVIAEITFDTDSYRRWEVMGEHAITLNFSLPQIINGVETAYLDIPVGSYINYKDNLYTLYNPTDFIKNGNRDYAYTLKLYAEQEKLNDCIFTNEPDGMRVFERTARPHEFLEAIVRNMNKFSTSQWDGNYWSIGDYIKNDIPRTVQFNGVSCMQALKDIATTFNTEFEIVGTTISLKKVEHYKNNALRLNYGGAQIRDEEHGGFIPGLGRSKFDENRPIYSLYVKGSDRNINPLIYGSEYLKMPKNRTISYDGTYFNDEEGFDSTIARDYRTDSNGEVVARVNSPAISMRESFIELTEAYPKHEGTITAIKWLFNGIEYDTYHGAESAAISAGQDAGAVFCDIIDSNNVIDYTNLRLGGEQAILVPQTGRLAGREIGIQQDEKSLTGYNHAEKRFKLITETDGNRFIPDERLQVGDTYAIFGISMPNEYIQRGELDLLKEAIRYKYENEEYKFTFNGTLDGIWAKRNWGNVGKYLICGGYIEFSDPQFHPQGTLIRISAIKEYLYEPESPEIELTNVMIKGGLNSKLSEIPRQEVVIDGQQRELAKMRYRRWEDSEETKNNIDLMYNQMGDAIRASSVESMYMRVGNMMGQFRFVNDLTSNVAVTPNVSYDPETNQVTIFCNSADNYSFIQHQTLGITDIDGASATGDNRTVIRPYDQYYRWELPPFTSQVLDKDKFYWIYARVSKGDMVSYGNFIVEEFDANNPRTFEGEDGVYWLVVGGLNSERDGTRSFTPMYGFTEILPGQITTGMIRSNSGETYFDLNAGEIAGKIDFSDGIISGNIGVYGGNGAITAMINGDNALSTNIAYSAGGNTNSAPFRVLHNGNLYASNAYITGVINATSGEFRNVYISGSSRSPFVNKNPGITIGGDPLPYNDNLITLNNAPGWRQVAVLYWDITQSGRRITIINYRNDSAYSQGALVYAPLQGSSQVFYENGEQYNELVVNQNEMVELIGYGTNNNFWGYIVVNRMTLAT